MDYKLRMNNDDRLLYTVLLGGGAGIAMCMYLSSVEYPAIPFGLMMVAGAVLAGGLFGLLVTRKKK